MDMGKTKLYEWKCESCNQTGILRITDPRHQKIRTEGMITKKYFITHKQCGKEIELINGRRG